MACQSISGLTYSCLVNTGGVKKIYIANFENVTSTSANTIGTLTGVTMASTTKFQEFTFNRDTCSIEEDQAINLENGTSFFTQTVNLIIPRREAAKRNNLLLLSSGQPKLLCVVEDQNGLFWLIGKDNGAYLTANKSGSGVKKGDANAYHLTIVGEEQLSAPEVDASIISTLI